MGFFDFLHDASSETKVLKFLVNPKKIIPEARNIAVGAARGIARVPETLTRSAVGAAYTVGEKADPNLSRENLPSWLRLDKAGTVTDPIRKTLYGSEPVQTYQQRTAGNEEVLKSSRFRGGASPLAFLGAGLTVAGDVTGAGGAKKAVVEEGVAAIEKQLAKEVTEAGVKKILKDKIAPELIDKVAPAVAHTKDANIVRNILMKATGAADEAKPVLNDVAPAIHPAAAAIDDHLATLNKARDNIVANGGNKVALAQNDRAYTAALKAKQDIAPAATNVSAIDKVVSGLREGGISQLQNEQKNLYSAERSTRLGKAYQAASDLTGREALQAQKTALSGRLPRVNSDALKESLRAKVPPEDVNGILDELRNHPNLSGYEPITAQNAVVGLFDEGKLPTKSEFAILEKASPQLAETIKTTAVDSMSNWDKVKDFGVQLLGMPKSIMASLDLSGGGRQGAVLGSRFLPEWGTAQKESVKYFASQDAFDHGMQEIASRDTFPLMQKAGVNLGPAGGHEEQFASTLAEKIPGVGRGVAASDRAYTGGLSRLRADAFDHIMHDLDGAGIDINTLTEKQLKSLGKFINTASGRGDLGVLEKHAQSLGEALFSPRLWKSRLDMLRPDYYAKLDPIARKYALQSAGSFAAIAGTVLALAVAAGAKVETDARSSDFLKIKVGDTRYDILGGFQQNLVFAHREITGEKKSSQTGQVTDLTAGKFGSADRLSILSDLTKNKENPVISTGQTLLKGKDKSGNDVNPVTEIGKLGVPLNIQDTYKTIQNTGSVPKGIAKSLPGTVGVGVGTYGIKDINPTTKQTEYLKKLKDSGASKEKIAASKLFFQTLKSAPNRDDVGTKIKAALKAGDTKKAQQLAQDYNTKYSETFSEWSKNNSQYSDRTLTKAYNSNKITTDTIKRWIVSIKKGD